MVCDYLMRGILLTARTAMWTLNFDQLKTFSKKYKPMRVYKPNFRSWLFFEFIQTQKRYAISLDKIRILTWKLLVISSQNFSCELNSQRTTPRKIPYICRWSFKKSTRMWQISKYTSVNHPNTRQFSDACF